MASSASTRWTWDDEKTDAFLLAIRNYKRQKLGEGIEWDSDKFMAETIATAAVAENMSLTMDAMFAILIFSCKHDMK